MKYLDVTLGTPAANLAVEDHLLEAADRGEAGEALRIWRPEQPFVVVGYANSVATEVDRPACQAGGIPVLRRISGGGTVVQGPGVLCYAVILEVERRPELATIPGTNAYVLDRVMAALQPLVEGRIERQGDTDLVLAGRKFAGNAQRRKRRTVLFHGSLLLQADLTMIGRLLRHPTREPVYRAGRAHGEFLRNLNLDPGRVAAALRSTWGASEPLPALDLAAVQSLAIDRYESAEWNARF